MTRDDTRRKSFVVMPVYPVPTGRRRASSFGLRVDLLYNWIPPAQRLDPWASTRGMARNWRLNAV
jgi:hypothetical protein